MPPLIGIELSTWSLLRIPRSSAESLSLLLLYIIKRLPFPRTSDSARSFFSQIPKGYEPG